MAAGRTLAFTKRYSLADLGDDWRDCYLTYRPLSPRALLELKALDPSELSEGESIDVILKFVRGRIVGGTVMVLGDQEQPVSAVAKPEDIDELPQEVMVGLFKEMNGASLDPKVTATPTETLSTPLATSELSTDSTPSSQLSSTK